MPRRRRWAILSLVVFVALVGLVVYAIRPPSWWVDRPAAGPDVASRAGRFEQACVSEIHLIRESAEPWAVRILEADVNAWLATRLDAWCRHVELEPLGQVEVRFSFGQCELAARVDGAPGIAVLPLQPAVRDGRIEPGLGTLRLGRLPLPFLVGAGVDALIESLGKGDGEDLRAVLVPLLRGDGIPASFELTDGRVVHLRDVEFRDGELLLQFETIAKRHP